MAYSWNELEEGLELTPVTGDPITRTDIVKYQGASGDFDAAHHDDTHAQSYGFLGVFSLGMLHAGQLNSYCNDIFGPENIVKFGLKFRDVVYPGDVLTFSGKVAGKSIEDGVQKVALELACTKQDGSPAVLGTASYIIP